MVARTRFAQTLAILLSAFLAWPSYVPFLTIESANPAQSEGLPRVGRTEPGFHNRDRKSFLDQESWSDFAGDFEGSDSRDDFPSSPMAFRSFSIDFTSLVPSPLEFRPTGSVDRSAPFLLAPHLRC